MIVFLADAEQFFSSPTFLRFVLLAPLALLGLFFAAVLLKSLFQLRNRKTAASSIRAKIWPPSVSEVLTGFITTFFDTFGVGSFATTTALFRGLRLVPDEHIPGTLNVGHTISGVIGAFIFIQLVPVSTVTLIPMIAAAMLGAWLGAGTVSRLPRRSIRLGMGMALLGAAVLMFLGVAGYLPAGGDALGLLSKSISPFFLLERHPRIE